MTTDTDEKAETAAVEDRADTLCDEIVGWLGDERRYAACMGQKERAAIFEEVIRKVEELHLEMPRED